MATFAGLQKRTIVDKIEIVSDDAERVLVIERDRGGDGTTLTVRLPWEGTWSATGGKFTLTNEEAQTIAAIVGGTDLSYRTEKIAKVGYASFTKDDPTPKADENCAPLDIERAKAANIAEERENLRLQLAIDHINDKHNPALDACVDCQNAIRPGHGDGSLREDEPFAATPSFEDDAELPF